MTQVAEKASSSSAPRRGKKLLIMLGGLVALLALLAALLPAITDAVVRPKVVAALRESLNGEPSVGKLSFSLFNGLELADLRIGNPPGFSAAPCVTVERVTADPKLLPLLGGKLVLNGSLRVVKPQVAVEQDAKGRLNLACLAKEQKPAAPAVQKPGAEAVAAPFVIASLLVEELGISVKTPALSRPAALSPLRIETRVETLDKPVTFLIKSADGSLDVKGQVLAARDGKLDLANLKAELDYTITPALLAPLTPALGSMGPLKRFEGTLAGAGRFALDGIAKPSGKGRLTLDVPQLALELAAGGANVTQTFRPGTIQFAYDFKARDARQTDLDWQLASPAVSVATKGVATADPAAPMMEGEVMIVADIAALGERFPGVIAAGRNLQGRVSGGIRNLKASAKTVAGDLDLRGEGLAEVGAGGAAVPLVRDLAVKLRLAADLDKGNYLVENLDARVDDALSAKGRLRIEQKAAGSIFEADLRASADLDALMARARRFTDLIPPTLPLAGRVDAHLIVPPEAGGQAGTPLNLQVEINGLKTSGIQIPYGEMDLTGIGAPGWTKFEAKSLSLLARMLPAGAPANQPPLEAKATGRATADFDAGRYNVPELRLALPGAGIAATAAVALPPKGGDLGTAQVKTAANAVGDVQSLLSLARIWGAAPDGMTARGDIAMQLEADGTLGQFAVRKLHAEVKEFAMSGPKSPSAIRWPQSLVCDAVLTLNALDPMKSPVEFLSGAAQAVGVNLTTLKGRLALDPKSDQSDLQIAGSVDPAALAAALPGGLNDVAVLSAPGPFEARLRGSAMGGRSEIVAKLELPETALKPPKLAGGPIRLGKPSLDVQASLDTAASAYRITRASLKTALANLDAQGNVALDAQGKLAALDGRLDGAADLAALGAVAVAVGSLAEGTELAGSLQVAAEVKAAGGAFPYSATLTGQGVRFKGPQTKGIAIDEPQPVVKLAGNFANTKDGFNISIAPGCELRAQTARGTVSGAIRSQANQPLSAENLAADLTYDPTRLKPLLAAFDAGEIRGAAPQQASIVFSGPLSPGENTLAWLGNIALAAKLGYGTYAYTDVIVEGPPLAVEMKGGRSPVDYACKINGGATTLRGNVDVNQRTQLALSAKDVGLTLGLVKFLGFLNSFINVEKGSIQGVASLDAVAAYEGPLPLPAPPNLADLLAARLAGRGTYSANNLRIQGSPMLTDIMNFLGQPSAETVGGIQPTNFVIERGEFRMDKAVMQLNGVELTLAGVVRFDQTLNLLVGLPMPKRFRDTSPAIAQYLPAAITVPVRGRVGATQVDYNAAVTAALTEAGSNALKGQMGDALKGKANDLLKGKAGDLLKGFLGGGNK
jgi:hypothetical protein